MIIVYYLFLILSYMWIDELIILKIPNDSKILDFTEIIKPMHNLALIMFISFLLITIPKYNRTKLFNVIYIGLIYIKYASLFYFVQDISVYKYELRRTIMWFFTTIAMLDMYTKVNGVSFYEIKPQYHLAPTLLYALTYYYKSSRFYWILYLSYYVSQGYFTYNLWNNYHYKYSRIILSIWMLFGFIGSLDNFNLISNIVSNIFFNIADLMAKYLMMILIYDLEEQKIEISNNVDLQSVNLISLIYNQINDFENNNELTDCCIKTIRHLQNELKMVTPSINKKSVIKLELLKKILPYDLDDKYLMYNINKYQHYENVCILFTDIVSYSEFASKSNSEQVYFILNDIYTKFDRATRKHKNLQKIETIGDSYMVIGDISQKISIQQIVEQMINLAKDLLNECKYVYLPDNSTVQIRIGIHYGPVVIGILGTDIPRLCVVGNTVNKTSRLESTAESNKIHISSETYDLIKSIDKYNFVLRENIYLKNIGNETTYYVDTNS